MELICSNNQGNEVTRLETSFYVDPTKPVQSILETWSLNKGEETYAVILNEQHKMVLSKNNEEISFNGLKVSKGSILERSNILMKELEQKVDYIGAIRKLPLRDFRIDNAADGTSGDGGLYNYTYLVQDSLTTEHKLLDKVSEWYKQSFEEWNLSEDKTQDPVFYINLENNGIKNNILDTGAGIIQSLPIVIAVCRECLTPSLLILEEPETHLHPAAHGDLAQLIAESIIENPNKHYFIETHSLNFILRLRTLVASGKISSKNLAMYFIDFDKEKVSSSIQCVEIKENGDVNRWPGDKVFNETYIEALNLRNSLKR
jgi:hypothetical protein